MPPYSWRLSFSIARTALALVCLALEVVYGTAPFSWSALPLLVFIAGSLRLLRRSMEAGDSPLLPIAIDAAAFVLWLAFASRSDYPDAAWMSLALAIFVYLLSGAVVTQSARTVAGVAAVALAGILAVPAPQRLSLAVPMACSTLLAAVWVLNRDHLDSRLFRASRHSVRYRLEALHAREDERQRIAADFHDGPMQSFIGFQMRLEILKKLLARSPNLASEELSQLQRLCHSQVNDLRQFVRNMRPADLAGESLGASISRMVEQFQRDTGISAAFMSREYVEPAQTELSLELLQVVREALNNVQKHANASRVSVALNKFGQSLEIAVDDNGTGFPFSGAYSLEELDQLRLGPRSIRRRVRAIRGELNLDSRPGRGTGLKVRVALA